MTANEKPILFSGPMIRALLADKKTQTRRIVKPQAPEWIKQWGFSCFTPKGSISGRGIYGDEGPGEKFYKIPFPIGTRLWVRETWMTTSGANLVFKADNGKQVFSVQGRGNAPGSCGPHGVWRPSIHMPKWAARIWLEVTGVRIERLNEISEEDAIAEGCEPDEQRVEQWWQGYDSRMTDRDGNLAHTQVRTNPPPDWLLEPKAMVYRSLAFSARDKFSILWNSTYGSGAWDRNDWVWVYEFKRIEGEG